MSFEGACLLSYGANTNARSFSPTNIVGEQPGKPEEQAAAPKAKSEKECMYCLMTCEVSSSFAR